MAEVGRVAPGGKADFAAAVADAFDKAGGGGFGAFVHAGFVFIELVIGAVGEGGDVGHDDIGSDFQGFFPSCRVDGLQGCRGGDVDVGHQEAQATDHVQAQAQAFPLGQQEVALFPERGFMVLQVGTHANHVDVHFFQEEQVLGKVPDGLPRQTNHDACAGLVAASLERAQAFQAGVEVMQGIAGVDLPVEGFVGSLDAQQVAVSSCFPPAAVGVLALFAQGKGDAQGAFAELFDFPDDLFDAGDESFVLAFPALEHDRPVAVAVGKGGGIQYVFFAEGIPPGLGVGTAYAAIEAVFDAAVGDFNQSPHIYSVA